MFGEALEGLHLHTNEQGQFVGRRGPRIGKIRGGHLNWIAILTIISLSPNAAAAAALVQVKIVGIIRGDFTTAALNLYQPQKPNNFKQREPIKCKSLVFQSLFT